MESRLIYKTSQHYIHKVEWLNRTYENGGWIFIGDGDNVDKKQVLNSIAKHLTDEILYISFTRNDSRIAPKTDIELAIADILGRYDFSIWDRDFKHVINFNKNGVMRVGKTEVG